MSHRNARLNVHGRRLLVARVDVQGWPVAHVAKAMGVSRQCAHRWVARFAAEGEAGLPTGPHARTAARPGRPDEVEQAVLQMRRASAAGRTGSVPSSGCRPAPSAGSCAATSVPYLRECDPLTGEVIRASKTTAVRYERDRPGELVHMDVKKIGKIPDGGGWRAHGRQIGQDRAQKKARIGYDYVHSMVDDHSRLAYSEILPDEKGPTCAGVPAPRRGLLRRPRHHPDRAGDDRQPLVSYPRSTDVAAAMADPRRQAQVHPAPLPMAERQGGEVQPHPASRVGLPAGLPHQRRPRRRPCTLARALQHSTPPHRTRRTPADQPPVTNLMAEYN